MNRALDDNTWMVINALRGTLGIDSMLTGAILVAETKIQHANESLSKEEAYDAMLVVADRLNTNNPFRNPSDFYSVYLQMNQTPDWEMMLYNILKFVRTGVCFIPDALLEQMTSFIKPESKTILIPEAEKLVPNLKSTIEAHRECHFTLTSTNTLYTRIIERLFTGYENVEVINASVYSYNFIAGKFDLILCMPAFGGRCLTENSTNFKCREYDMVAFENLLHYIAPEGKLVIIMPARITFAAGQVSDLRKLVTQMYKLEEIAELPDGLLRNTGIKTFMFVVGDGHTEGVIVRRYEALDRKTKRGPVDKLELAADTFVNADELEENGDWNIDKLLARQDEELMRFNASDIKKIKLGDVAEIFRGKSVMSKEESGNIGIINISNIGQYEIDYSLLYKLEEEERKVQTYILKEGDVVLPARGTAIRAAVFHEQEKTPCIASSNVIVIRPKANALNSTFLKIFIDSPVGHSMLGSLQQGMTVMNISYKDLKMLEIPLISLKRQNEIATEYKTAYRKYIDTVSEAEKKWEETCIKLQDFGRNIE